MYDKAGPSEAPSPSELPRWTDDSRGTRNRVALWLLQEVGLGEVFTKSMLRAAFPGVEQIDRRMRDLRQEGWRIDTANQDPTLHLDELRFVEPGAPVWDPKRPKDQSLSARTRKAVLERDRFSCVVCGIAGGETYPEDSLRRAQLAVSKRGAGEGISDYVTLCDMCRRAGISPSVDRVLPVLGELTDAQRHTLRSWLVAGRRERDKLESAWALASRLAPSQQEELVVMLGNTDAVAPTD